MVKEEGDQERQPRGPRTRHRRGSGAQVVEEETSDDGEEAPKEDAEEQQEQQEEDGEEQQDAFYNADEVVGLDGILAPGGDEEDDPLFREEVQGESLGKNARLPHLRFEKSFLGQEYPTEFCRIVG